MNRSPRENVEGARTVISFMAVLPEKNRLEKGQNTGTATKVTSAASLESIDIQMPTIDTKVESHSVGLDGYRTLNNGQKASISVSENKRKMQLARIKEQKVKNKDLSGEAR